ncbi:MAG TPA: ATP-binding protein [Kofleriaceae bacterium]|nr:ATP-binding protein [Kofleriaceae bacterium]
MTRSGETSGQLHTDEFRVPSAEEMLHGVLAIGREIHLEMSEEEIIGRFQGLLVELFPHRFLVVRVIDLRSPERAKVYPSRGEVRPGFDRERITLKRSSAVKTRLKRALAQSARVRLSDRWDSPFPGVAHGFAVPLVASGELYGVLDIGYPLGSNNSAADEPLVIPLANHLSVALRNERLHRETTLLRDYQSKLIEHANALILGVDRHWRITLCNQALCKLTGYSRGELMGRDLRDWLPPEERGRLSHMVLRALTGGSGEIVEIQLATKAGGRVRTVWSMAAISTRGDIQAVVAVGQDQTRLSELQNQVIQAEKLATLGQLAAGVVHELNNPLTSITVYAEYLLKKSEQKARAGDPVEQGDIDKLKRISAGAHRILTFARDLVQYAKPAGSRPEVVSLSSVVRQSLSFCEHLFERARILLEQHLDDALPPVEAVPGQLEQVVINLVTNAVQACAGEGRVAVRTHWAGNNLVAVSVADSGPGVPEPERERVFEPFFTTKTDGSGTGLGLSIVRNIVEQHRGRVSVATSEWGGALFVCEFPASGADA